ncbi:MAG TPA: hypothetical protein VF316_22470 [Polyangiaceae bacterium]
MALALVLCARGVQAQDQSPSASDQALAQTLFDEAVQLMDHGKYGDACPKLAESQKLDPGGGTLLNLGLCREKEGKLASAWVAYNASLSQAIKDHRTEREATARQRIGIIEGSLAKIVVLVSAGARATPGLEVLLDGTPVRAAAWGLVTPIDRGSHVLVATAPGKQPWKSVLVVPSDGLSVQAEVPELLDAKAAAPSAPSVVEKPATGMALQVFGGWVSISVGGAILVAGSILGGIAIDRRKQSDAECPNERCTQRGVDLNEQAKTFAWLADVGIGIGIAGVGAGIVLLLTAPKKPAQSAVQVIPMLGPNGGGLGAIGTF